MRINGTLYRTIRAPRKNNDNLIKVQLGPGQKNYLAGWINVDSNLFTAKVDVWSDIRYTLPFKDESVDFFYSHHVIEHLPDLTFHLKDMYRALKKDGKIRIGGPNGDTAIRKYLENDHAWFINFPDERESIGGKLENFLICRQEHLTILTPSFLKESLENVGFKNVKVCLATKETRFPEIIDQNVLGKEWETDLNFPMTLLVEAEK
ncbi:methyltransferase domain-containing protein [uncultured Arcticibacterium sp.]|uniref:class I SAM-dependent methyltransferase n=1 Tax=uncultured Arcticibacterium sp. TaxID=2173042 RepID=UPI0030F993AB